MLAIVVFAKVKICGYLKKQLGTEKDRCQIIQSGHLWVIYFIFIIENSAAYF